MRLSRRQFLRGGLAAAAGAAITGAAPRAWARHSDFVSAVVIGSGFGGAVAALRLGQAGVEHPQGLLGDAGAAVAHVERDAFVHRRLKIVDLIQLEACARELGGTRIGEQSANRFARRRDGVVGRHKYSLRVSAASKRF